MEEDGYNGNPVWTEATIEPPKGQAMYDMVADACHGNRRSNGEVRFDIFDEKGCEVRGFCLRALKSAARFIDEKPKAHSEILRREHRRY